MTTGQTLQMLCETGQRELMEMRYLQAEKTLVQAEQLAWSTEDWDVLARLYMPLQETRRQRRQRCGEGIVCLDLLATSSADKIDPARILENYPHGQLLVAGWASFAPAIGIRLLQPQRELFVETFLAAVYPTSEGSAVVIAALPEAKLPKPRARESRQELQARLPAGMLLLNADELPAGPRRGTDQTYGQVMALWERLHTPFLIEADRQVEPLQKMQAYRKAIEVDYACELAHQHLSHVARALAESQARKAV